MVFVFDRNMHIYIYIIHLCRHIHLHVIIYAILRSVEIYLSPRSTGMTWLVLDDDDDSSPSRAKMLQQRPATGKLDLAEAGKG